MTNVGLSCPACYVAWEHAHKFAEGAAAIDAQIGSSIPGFWRWFAGVERQQAGQKATPLRVSHWFYFLPGLLISPLTVHTTISCTLHNDVDWQTSALYFTICPFRSLTYFRVIFNYSVSLYIIHKSNPLAHWPKFQFQLLIFWCLISCRRKMLHLKNFIHF